MGISLRLILWILILKRYNWLRFIRVNMTTLISSFYSYQCCQAWQFGCGRYPRLPWSSRCVLAWSSACKLLGLAILVNEVSSIDMVAKACVSLDHWSLGSKFLGLAIWVQEVSLIGIVAMVCKPWSPILWGSECLTLGWLDCSNKFSPKTKLISVNNPNLSHDACVRYELNYVVLEYGLTLLLNFFLLSFYFYFFAGVHWELKAPKWGLRTAPLVMMKIWHAHISLLGQFVLVEI